MTSSGPRPTKLSTAATPRVQRAVGRAIRLKFTPRLVFKLDERVDERARLSAILRQIEEGEDDETLRSACKERLR